jgi:transketolase
LSKGHIVPLAYSILADQGYFPKEELATFRKLGTRLQGHPDRLRTPGIEASTGPLSEGFSMALGIALAQRVDKKPNHVWVITGDGEHQEGETWEAIMAAGFYKTDNLTVILDYNKKQNTCECEKIMDIAPIADKYRAFNWNVIEIDGHDFGQIIDAYRKALAFKGKPTVIIANTIKGKGVTIFEQEASGFHGAPPNPAEFEAAMAQLGPAKWPDFF